MSEPDMKKLPILSPLLLAGAIGCSGTPDSLNADQARLVPVYAELLVLREQFQAPGSQLDSLTHRRKADSLLATIGVTQEEFTNKITELGKSQKQYQEFQLQVRMVLDKTKSTQNQ